MGLKWTETSAERAISAGERELASLRARAGWSEDGAHDTEAYVAALEARVRSLAVDRALATGGRER